VFGCGVRALNYADRRATSCRVWLHGSGALFGSLLGHVLLCLAARYWSSIRQVAGSCHVVVCCAVLELA
jgi:hypothetical protein